MALFPKYRADVPRVKRFSLEARVAHWGHAFTFFICFVSGMAIYFGSPWLAAPFGGLAGASLVHRVSALGLTAFILYYFIVGFGSLLRWCREILRFGRQDLAFLTCFPRKLFGMRVEVPPQTKLNGGEKLNSVVISLSVLTITVSGYVIWFSSHFEAMTVRAAYLAHAISMIVATSIAVMHAYLGSLHPETGESFWGMWKGTVRADWARKHHSLWFEEQHQPSAADAPDISKSGDDPASEECLAEGAQRQCS